MANKDEVAEKKENVNVKPVQNNFGVEKVLVENFVSLQKVMTNLAVRFDSLSNQISKLLELFEISAKTLAERDYDSKSNEENKKVVEKLDNLLEQNKIIAKGIALLHERNSEQGENMISVEIPPTPAPQQMVRPQQENRMEQRFIPRVPPTNPPQNPKFGNVNR